MKFWVTLEGGRDAEVEVKTDRDHVWLETEGRRLSADFSRLPDGEVYSLIVDGRSHVVRVSPRDGALGIVVENTPLRVEVRHPLEKLLATLENAAGRAVSETIVAPMPGVVVALRVKPGDRVAAGQAVVVVEAMKMQNELTARHGGIVAEVFAAERDAVQPGQALVRITPEHA